MSNLTHLLTYLRASAPTTASIFSRDRLAAVPKHPAFTYLILFLVSVAAMVIFTLSEFRELRERHQEQQDRLAAIESDTTDMEGRIPPESDLSGLYDNELVFPCPTSDLLTVLEWGTYVDEDGFLPPFPASELLTVLESGMLVDDDGFLPPCPASDFLTVLESGMLDVDDMLSLYPELSELYEEDDFDAFIPYP